MVAAELVIALMVAVPATALAGLMAAAVALTVFSAGTLLAVRRGTELTCNCFGRSGKRLGTRHVVRDCALAVVALTGVSGIVIGSSAVRPAGTALCLGAAAIAAAFVVFADDITGLFGSLRSGADVPLWAGELEEEQAR
jgi:xanthosine utilization system XapX-like protein